VVVTTPEAADTLRGTTFMHCYVGCCDKLNASSSDDGALRFRPHQMNAALELIENHRLDGIVYFADEEGIYSLDLFKCLRQVRYCLIPCSSSPICPPTINQFPPPPSAFSQLPYHLSN
jgi:hypothetical protein